MPAKITPAKPKLEYKSVTTELLSTLNKEYELYLKSTGIGKWGKLFKLIKIILIIFLCLNYLFNVVDFK
jgi:hypothetical protein